MVEWTANVVRIRTTGGANGPAVGVVTGEGATPGEALAGLRKGAEGPAREAVRRVAEVVEAAKRPKERVKERSRGLPRPSVVSTDSPLEVSVTHKPASPPSVITLVRDVGKPQRRWQFEVVGVRLVPAHSEGGAPGWLAYGTLVWDLPGT